MLKTVSVLLSFLMLISGCIKNEATKCEYDACATKAPANEIQAVKDYLASVSITNATEHCSGVLYVIDTAGTGNAPTSCGTVNATYTGKLTNGNTFDAGTTQFGLSSVIPGWTNTIPLIKNGGKIRLFIPPSLGYGTQGITDSRTGNVIIPPNAILLFDVRLNAVY